jgi:16S rRNA A1518/A1519 N6-dimethyltransferase RsmA/KsgA/DIM1 with predicted DNA glycosylase/AP lyase activity
MGLDMDGKPVIWSSKGQQVMMEWEKEYMHQCVDALKISTSDRVLEIGFGLAYSATHIQSFRPSKHVIIECDEKILKYAKDFEATHSSAEIIPGTWQQELSKVCLNVFFLMTIHYQSSSPTRKNRKLSSSIVQDGMLSLMLLNLM